MKNRKTVVVAFLLVAMLLVGVGFAQLTDQLLIRGAYLREEMSRGRMPEAQEILYRPRAL